MLRYPLKEEDDLGVVNITLISNGHKVIKITRPEHLEDWLLHL